MEHAGAVADNLIQTTTKVPDFIKKIIAGDELLVYSYDPEANTQSFQWKLPDSPYPKKVRQSHNQIKTMLTVSLIRKVSVVTMPLQAKLLIRSTTSIFFII